MRTLILISLLVEISYSSLAQQMLSGQISMSDGSVTEGITVLNLSSGQHTHTDQFGLFTINQTEPGDSLVIRHVGVAEQKLMVGDYSDLQITVEYAAIELAQIIITPNHQVDRNLTALDLQLNPVNSSQEILRKVPGLFIAQHAGGGKAEQIFLRGFDIDHGTDVAISVDGLPVNMVSHAHGQGYADLHFVIPETIENIDFDKGPYQTDQGNFSTAGYVRFNTKNQIEDNLLKVEFGQFNTQRVMSMINLIPEGNTDAYLATEYQTSDGPFKSPQNFHRLNVLGKLNKSTKNSELTLMASSFESEWSASGQVPQRAVDDGLISRFGAIDDTEGGRTTRSNLSAQIKTRLDGNSFIENQVYYVDYDFELYSNFTFFLNDPTNGDQIRQREKRGIFGLSSHYRRYIDLNGSNLTLDAGVQIRRDQISDNELSHTLNRKQILDSVAYGDISESNQGLYSSLTWENNRWLVTAGARIDHFDFEYRDQLSPVHRNQSTSRAIISPKVGVSYSPNLNLRFFIKAGKGYHSNDTRSALTGMDMILPSAYGFDAGFDMKLSNQLFIKLAYWELHMDQEFVYVGDEGVVELSGATLRKGIDISTYYQPITGLYIDGAINICQPRSLDGADGSSFIPLAPTLTSVGGISYKNPVGFAANLRYRFMADRPANETNSVTAIGYALADFTLNYTSKKLGIGISVNNLFDQEWNEAQFDTESRLANEDSPISEIHFTPGTPRFFKLTAQIKF